jgi:ribose 5-phosphate isomerase B
MLYIASDHRGYNLKEFLKGYLSQEKIPFKDVGNHKFDPEDDYPDFAFKLAREVAKNHDENIGVMACGSGLGMVVAANKIKGIRAGLVMSEWFAEHGKENDDLNVISFSADKTDFSSAERIFKKWMSSKFNNSDKYRRRLEKIKKVEEENFK